MTGSSPADIVNTAHSYVGGTKFFDDLDGSATEQKVAKLLFDKAYLKLLRRAEWTFSKRRRALSVGDNISGEWAYCYDYPSNCAMALMIEDTLQARGRDEQLPFVIESSEDGMRRVIYTDVEGAILVYTADDVPVGLATPEFADALAWALAVTFATKSTDKQLAREMYKQALAEAVAIDYGEGIDPEAADSGEMRARGGT